MNISNSLQVDASMVYCEPFGGQVPIQSTSIDPWASMDADEDYWLSAFLNLEPDESLLAQQNPLDTNDSIVVVQPLSSGSFNSFSPNTAENVGRNAQSRQSEPSASIPPIGKGISTQAKRKAEKIDADVWERMFPVISELYSSSELPDMLRTLPEKHSFNPSRKQLKTKITQWQKTGRLQSKYIKKVDMDYMVLVAHLRQKNERLETLFTYYGFPVSPEKLQSHENRCGIQHRDIDIQKPPQHIAWTTPSTPTAAELLSQGKPPKASSSPESKERSGSVSPYQLPDVEPTLEQVRPAVINEKSNDTIRSEHQNSQISTGYSKKQAGTPGHSLKKETPLINPERRQRSWAIQLQSESTPVSVEQLSSEVKSIYAGLAMIETKCIAVDRGLVETINSNEEHTLSTDQWQALTALHKTLLHEHHDFLLVSQHPLASPPLRRLAKKYSMTARMWKHGCHSYLELLRRHLPRSLDHMHAFLYHAIQIYNLLYEFIPAFEDIWTEILGDLSRYKMVIEEDPRDREIWARNARSWYTRMADLKPMIGRLDHHMAILSGHNPMCKLFFYAKSLTSENIFFASRDYMTVSLQSASDVRNLQAPPMNPLLKTHISIFLHKFDEAQYHLKEYLDTLSIHLLRDLDKWAESGAQIAIANISSLFDYGNSSALRYLFDIANFLFSMEPEEDPVNQELPDGLKDPSFSDIRDLEGERVKYNLILNTFKTVLSYRKRPSTFPHVQCIAAFLVSLAEAVQLTNKRFASSLFYSQSIFDVVPWEPLCDYLNDFQSSGDCQDHTVPDTFPHSNTLDCRPLPEDYMLRGLVWTNQYFPETWFDGTPWDVEDRVEGQIWSLASSMNTMRVDRILWLGRKLAAHGHINYDQNKFSPIQHSRYPSWNSGIDSTASVEEIDNLWHRDVVQYGAIDLGELDTVSTPRTYSSSQVASTGLTPLSSANDPELVQEDKFDSVAEQYDYI